MTTASIDERIIKLQQLIVQCIESGKLSNNDLNIYTSIQDQLSELQLEDEEYVLHKLTDFEAYFNTNTSSVEFENEIVYVENARSAIEDPVKKCG